MLNNPSEFIARFLYHIGDDEHYWAPGSPPSRKQIAQAASVARDHLETLASHLNSLPRDQETLSMLGQLLERIAGQPNAAPVFKALDKLTALLPDAEAAKLRRAASPWQ